MKKLKNELAPAVNATHIDYWTEKTKDARGKFIKAMVSCNEKFAEEMDELFNAILENSGEEVVNKLLLLPDAKELGGEYFDDQHDEQGVFGSQTPAEGGSSTAGKNPSKRLSKLDNAFKELKRTIPYYEVYGRDYVIKRGSDCYIFRCCLNPGGTCHHSLYHPLDKSRAKLHLDKPSMHDPPCHLWMEEDDDLDMKKQHTFEADAVSQMAFRVIMPCPPDTPEGAMYNLKWHRDNNKRVEKQDAMQEGS
ncbi:hypothetical protein B0T16DRAFT_457032 [Cercophora newfieldiana]|uniref:Uncharacterized protein n=1 Tax=Cercophora newfieldiana TaxID=92897 RepID=A0AA39YBS7_9PEZI|nr:hypothetical protein B0T16DRAFT_457032 [Cercophora newfieldiana]